MKTLLLTLLTLTLLAGALLATHAQDVPCDPNVDPTCHQECPRDGGPCVCTWEPDCTRTPPPDPVKPLTPMGTPEPGDSNPLAGLVGRMRTINFTRLLEGAP